MGTLLASLIVYYAISIFVGLVRTKNQSPEEYIVAQDSMGMFPITISLLGTIVGGGMFLGIAQLGFKAAPSAFAIGVAYLLGSVVFGLLAPALRRYARENGIRTLFGVFDRLYARHTGVSVGNCFAWVSLGVFFLMLAVQFVGIASFFSFYSKLHFNLGILLGASLIAVVSTLLYSVIGGFKRDVYTDIVQVAFIVIGLMPVVVGLAKSDLRGAIAGLPPEVFSVDSSNLIFFLGSLLFVAPTFLVRVDLWQRAIAAKSDAEAKLSFFISGLASFFFFLLFGLMGLYGRAINIGSPQFVGLEVVQRVVAPWATGLAMGAFFAAVISSADTFLGVAGLSAARGSSYRFGELEAASTKVSVRRLRFYTLVIGLLSVAVAFLLRDIIEIFASAFGILMVFLPALVGGLIRKSPGELEARASVFAGLVTVVPLVFFIPTEAFLPGILVSTLAYVILARRNRSGSTAA